MDREKERQSKKRSVQEEENKEEEARRQRLAKRLKGSRDLFEMFPELNADVSGEEVTVMESLCLSCTKQGTTKLMLAKIPFFKEVVISSFQCPHCHHKNAELSSVMDIEKQGVEFVLKVVHKDDLNRVIVKTDYACIIVPELELEIPANTQKGEVTTVEGVLDRVVQGLTQDQSRRKLEHSDAFEKIQIYLSKIADCKNLTVPFTLKLRDASGNSFVSGRNNGETKDTQLTCRKWDRSDEENKSLGMQSAVTEGLPGEFLKRTDGSDDDDDEEEEEDEKGENLKDEVLQMPTNCPECNTPCFTKMKVTDIPHFKEVIIMATDCEKCGHRTNEVKSGGGIEPKGKLIQLKVTSKDDLSRDLLKSETCAVQIEELELVAGGAAIVGKFTTVEGILMDIRKQFAEDNPFISGDSATPSHVNAMTNIRTSLDRFITGQHEFTLSLNDPAGNSYIQNIFAPEEDPNLTITIYERSFEQNDELGLNDMKV